MKNVKLTKTGKFNFKFSNLLSHPLSVDDRC